MDVSTYAWIGWLILILIFVVVEMLTIQLTFLMIAIGCLAGLVSGLFGVHWWLQLIIAAIVAILLLFTIRPWLLRLLGRGGDPARSNVDALIGLRGQVVETVSGTGGQVRLANGETWTSRISPTVTKRELPAGEAVLVIAIDGATALVVPEENSFEERTSL